MKRECLVILMGLVVSIGLLSGTSMAYTSDSDTAFDHDESVTETSIKLTGIVVPSDGMFPRPEPYSGSEPLSEPDIQDSQTSLPNNSFVLLTSNKMYIVLTDQKVRRGIATVRGSKIGDQVLMANSIKYETQATDITIDELTSNPDKYGFDLVEIESQHHQVSTRLQPGNGLNYGVPITAGLVTKSSMDLTDQNVGEEIRKRILQDSVSSPDLFDFDNATGVPTFSTEESFWSSAESVVRGGVVPSKTFKKYADNSLWSDSFNLNSNTPVVFVVNRKFTDSNVVTKHVNATGTKISVKEFAERASDCSDIKVPLPSGSCIKLGFDNLIYAGVMDENSTPIIGISSGSQSDVYEGFEGKFRITGEFVDASAVNSSFSGSAFLIYEMEKTEDVDVGLNDEADDVRDAVADGIRMKGWNNSVLNQSIIAVIAGEDGEIDFEDLREAILYWSQDRPVPNTGGKKIDFQTLREIIEIWSKNPN